jgi:glycerate kinase
MREKKTAVMEMALASGLALLKDGERNPMMATSRGTGELILHAAHAGAKNIILGIGGSATCDGGIGALSALGVRFMDKSGRELDAFPGSLSEIRRIDLSRLDRELMSLEIQIACDVENPLLGAEGAARVYAPQKGADKAQVLQLEKGLANFARAVELCTGVGIAGMRGAGAAGGIGGAFYAILGARMRKGTDIIFDALDVERKIRGSDLVFTGEGRIDFQTAFGKAPAEIAKIARRHGVPCIALCGSLGDDVGSLHEIGIDAAFPICRGPASLEYAMRNAHGLLASAAEEAMRAFLAGFTR